MLYVVYGQDLVCRVTLEDRRINTSSNVSIRYLFKFTNDMSGAVKYTYGIDQIITDRFTHLTCSHNTTESVFAGDINLTPNGFWKYEIYEVSWIDIVSLSEDTAPATETDVLLVADENGVVEGRVEVGKLLVSETAGSEEVQYTQHPEPSGTNYIYTQ